MQNPYTPNSSIVSAGIFGEYAWGLAFDDAQRRGGFTIKNGAAIIGLYHFLAPQLGLNPDTSLAQGVEETGWFQSTLWLERFNPCGLGITGEGVLGKDYGSMGAGVMAHLAHLCCYAFTSVTCPMHGTDKTPKLWGDPRHTFHDGMPKLSHLQEPKPGRRWAEGPGYVGNILAVLDRVAPFASAAAPPTATPEPTPIKQERPMNGKERTDHLIATLRSRGLEVIDRRGLNPVNPNPAYRYGQVRGGIGGVTKVIQHWTGDGFDRATITQIVKKDYGLDTISAQMSVEDEIDLLVWYANYHISKDGGIWGGIAYGISIFPSGRIYVNWDIGTLTYHAFNVNGYSYALCFPSSQGQGPTPACLKSINHIWYYLFEETPEMPAGWSDLYGHNEAKIFDPQNQTSCPGTAMTAQVRAARESGAPTVNIATNGGTALPPPSPTADPISAALLAWYARLPIDVQGDRSNATFYEADLDFSKEIASIQGKQRGIVGEYASGWFHPSGAVLPIHSTLIAKLLATGQVRRR